MKGTLKILTLPWTVVPHLFFLYPPKRLCYYVNTTDCVSKITHCRNSGGTAKPILTKLGGVWHAWHKEEDETFWVRSVQGLGGGIMRFTECTSSILVNINVNLCVYRWAVFKRILDEIDTVYSARTEWRKGDEVPVQYHIGGGSYS